VNVALNLMAHPALRGLAQDPGFSPASLRVAAMQLIWAWSRPKSSKRAILLYAFIPDSGANSTQLLEHALENDL
jgi:hypothetical protein